MYQKLAFFLLLGLFGMANSCGASSRSASAEFCVAIDVHAKADEALFKMLDQFARNQPLIADTSSMVSREYRSQDGTVVVSLDLGMGQFGAILTFYRFNEHSGQSVLDALALYVDQEIARHWRVTACEDINGFRTPRIFE